MDAGRRFKNATALDLREKPLTAFPGLVQLTQDGDAEGVFRLMRLPTPKEAARTEKGAPPGLKAVQALALCWKAFHPHQTGGYGHFHAFKVGAGGTCTSVSDAERFHDADGCKACIPAEPSLNAGPQRPSTCGSGTSRSRSPSVSMPTARRAKSSLTAARPGSDIAEHRARRRRAAQPRAPARQFPLKQFATPSPAARRKSPRRFWARSSIPSQRNHFREASDGC